MTLAERRLFRPLGEPVPEESPYGIEGGKAAYWVTRDRCRVAIVDMTDAHLINTVNMLERGIERRQAVVNEFSMFAGACRGEMASYYAAHAADEAEERFARWLDGTMPILVSMRGELDSRGLIEVMVPLVDGASPTRWLKLPRQGDSR